MEWVGSAARQEEYLGALDSAETVKDLNALLLRLEKSFGYVDMLVTDDELEPEENGQAKSEDSGIDFQRNLRKMKPHTRKSKQYTKVKKSIKLWSYYFQNMKNLFRDYLAASQVPSSAFVGAILLCVTVIRFISSSPEKE